LAAQVKVGDTPPYYKSPDNSLQPLDVVDAYNLDFYLGNAVKYILRAGRKTENGEEDLRKAMHYLQLRLERKSK
jgi:hypothetical protein